MHMRLDVHVLSYPCRLNLDTQVSIQLPQTHKDNLLSGVRPRFPTRIQTQAHHQEQAPARISAPVRPTQPLPCLGYSCQQLAQATGPSLLVVALIVAPVARLVHHFTVELRTLRIPCAVHHQGFRMAAIGICFVELADHVGRHAHELCSASVSSDHG